MKRGQLICGAIITLFLIAILFINGCYPAGEVLTTGQCTWIFKTNGNYSNLIGIYLNNDESKIMSYPETIPKWGLNLHNNYYATGGACSYPKSMHLAYTSVTKDEWNESQEDCYRQMRDKQNQLIIQKCGSLNFTYYEECFVHVNPDSVECKKPVKMMPEVPNPTTCVYNITIDESRHVNSCESLIDSEYLMGKIIDSNPFTELYICKPDVTEGPGILVALGPNQFIDSNFTQGNCTKAI